VYNVYDDDAGDADKCQRGKYSRTGAMASQITYASAILYVVAGANSRGDHGVIRI